MNSACAISQPTPGHDITSLGIKLVRLDANKREVAGPARARGGCQTQTAGQGPFVVHIMIGGGDDKSCPGIAFENLERRQQYFVGRTKVPRLLDDVTEREGRASSLPITSIRSSDG